MHHNLILIAPSAFSCTDFLATTPSFLDHQHIDFEHQQFHRYRKHATSWPDSLFRFP